MPSSPSEALPFAALPVTPEAADFTTLPVPSVELDLGGSEDLTGQAHGARQQGPSGATIVVEAANAPCEAAPRALAARFVTAARGRRGVVASVESAGALHVGDRIRLL